jgi:uncharacterized protein (TIGR02646 family)
MKHIAKTGAPRRYLDWCKAVKGKGNEDYRRLQNPEKEILQKALLDEQGFICAYTMRRIDFRCSHIEHIKPETLCRTEDKLKGVKGSDLEYRNLLACFPKEGMSANYRYGAQAKGHWWENNGESFISPLNIQCESLLTFNLKGEVDPAENNINAKKTIGILKLDHASLTDDRRRAIQQFIFGPSGDDPISIPKARQAINDIKTRSKSGVFVEFCIAIKYALAEHIKNVEKRSQKKKAIQQTKAKK